MDNFYEIQITETVEKWFSKFKKEYNTYCVENMYHDYDNLDRAIDYIDEFAWEQEISLDLSLYVMAKHSSAIDWSFFKDVLEGFVDSNSYETACTHQAIWLILRLYLIPLLKEDLTKLQKSRRNRKELWKGTLDPDRIRTNETGKPQI